MKTQYIVIINTDLANDPVLLANFRSPVTTEHSLTTCPSCGTDAWIGPKQRLAATQGLGTKACIKCLHHQGVFDQNITLHALNPGIENTPRRFGR